MGSHSCSVEMCGPNSDAKKEVSQHNFQSHTCTVAHAFVFHNVFMLERFEDLDFPLKVTDVLSSAVLQFFHSYNFTGAVLQGVIPAHLHTAKISLKQEIITVITRQLPIFYFYYFSHT